MRKTFKLLNPFNFLLAYANMLVYLHFLSQVRKMKVEIKATQPWLSRSFEQFVESEIQLVANVRKTEPLAFEKVKDDSFTRISHRFVYALDGVHYREEVHC